jgi:DNA-binding transcriptional LysR family regulator
MPFRYESIENESKALASLSCRIRVRLVTGAAQRPHMTPPAVSRLIGDLEKELGLALFARQRSRTRETIFGHKP